MGAPLDLGIKATSVYLRFERKKKSLYSREEWHTVMMLTQVCTLAAQRQAGWCMFYFKGCRDKQSDRGPLGDQQLRRCDGQCLSNIPKLRLNVLGSKHG